MPFPSIDRSWITEHDAPHICPLCHSSVLCDLGSATAAEHRLTRVSRCHFDLKPNNILLFPGESGRRFDFRLKLGDLGSSVHCPLIDDSPNAAAYALQKPGTRTYGK